MNRRDFLALIGLGTPALVLDPELALWVPGRKTFFLPSEPVYRVGCNQCGLTTCPHLLMSDWITREALRLLENNLAWVSNINRAYDENWLNDTVKVGPTVNVRAPRRFA